MDKKRKRFALVSKVASHLFELVVPDRCRVCDVSLGGQEGRTGICRACLGKVTIIGGDWCRCGRTRFKGIDRGQLCSKCLPKRPSYHKALAFCFYDEPVNILLQRLKFNSDTTVLPALKTIAGMASELHGDSPPELILPVPLHRRRLKTRGLNQSLLLARLLFPEELQKIDPFLLERPKYTSPQTGLSGIERRQNLRDGFHVRDFRKVENRRIYLVDDVFTTGTTVEECSKTLIKAGASEIVVITFARVAKEL